MSRFERQAVFNGGVVVNILNMRPQEEEASGAQSIKPTGSLMRFSDPDTPAASNITLGKTGFSFGDLLLVYNDCVADTDVVLLAASIEDANNITLASQHDLTVLLYNGTNWAHVAGTAPSA
jgi:hypothetical protein